jgi:hypothetical protein
MRKLFFDCYEVNTPCSEEELELAIAPRSQCPNWTAFATDCKVSTDGNPPPENWKNWEHITRYVQKFAGIDLPSLEKCSVVVVHDEWDDLELVIETPSEFIWFHWSTTA